jgi:hypothetical protein
MLLSRQLEPSRPLSALIRVRVASGTALRLPPAEKQEPAAVGRSRISL